ncbi:MAG: 4Fe-4S binding protein [Planctomycetes bacterium]|nr:4Fe-4S binding protein [Planctomycetota bacterium]
MGSLARVIRTIPEKCVSCHRCISVCPVKFANEAHDDAVKINHDRCIGCGQCVYACEHKARVGVDDFDLFLADLHKGVRMIAIVAPAIASNFPATYMNLNGWLRSLGIAAVFDVSFGAELTVKSYLEHVKRNNPACVIAQPCPAIVSYCQIYRPELLPHLAPADSPMLHLMRMIKRYIPEYSGCRIAVISPCLAKRREFDETGLGDYNVTFNSLKDFFRENGIRLESYPAVDYDNPPAERAVLFSTPGGLMQTAERFIPGISKKIRKIEGPDIVYHYLDELPEMIRTGRAPPYCRLPELRSGLQRRHRRAGQGRSHRRSRGGHRIPESGHAGTVPAVGKKVVPLRRRRQKTRPETTRQVHKRPLAARTVRPVLPRPFHERPPRAVKRPRPAEDPG